MKIVPFAAAAFFVLFILVSCDQANQRQAPENSERTSPLSGQVNVSEDPVKTPKMMTMEVNKAIIVTVELDFGKKIPTISEALRHIQRSQQPADGRGRTFAIIDAYGEPTPEGKLHLSMHVSTEKPGVGALVFSRTGEVLWQSKIVAAKNPEATPFTGKNLAIYIDNGNGESFLVDGTGNPNTILEAKLRSTGQPIKSFWPDGVEREVIFIYSACGCPVKVMAKRMGERTIRTKDQPVIFPDDPPAVATIQQLMRW